VLLLATITLRRSFVPGLSWSSSTFRPSKPLNVNWWGFSPR
jgi:hypothetical protein